MAPACSDTCAAPRSSSQSFKNGPRFPNARRLPFDGFNNKYVGGACCIVGRGPTTFNYAELANITDPIFFINDAVCLEKYVRSESFFFAHDREMRIWLDGSITSTAVLPVDGTVLGEAPGVVLGHAAPVVYYRRGEKNKRDLLQMSRDDIADREQLFVHSGTIHSLLHFIWFCGFRHLVYIGCDGINRMADLARAGASPGGYDHRLQNRSSTAPLWQYPKIRMAQDLLTTLFGIEATYLGTPSPV